MKTAVHAIAALLLCSCASNRYFAPRIATGGFSASGMPVAIYGFGEGPGRAELRIWSDGAELYEDGAGKRTRLHVGLELINLGEGTLALEPAQVHVQDLQGSQDGPVLVPEAEPVQVQGSGTAAKGRTARLALWFEPPGLRPRQIDGFDVRWKVQIDADHAVEQVTPFGTWTMPAYYPYYPYGWPDSYWGWGWGWGFAPHHICH